MAETQETIADIIAETRDKYTVHECNQCAWRKCCSKGFGSEECDKFRESIFLKLGIEDGYFTQLLDRFEAAHKRERGDAAKLREAAMIVYDVLEKLRPFSLCLRDVGRTREFNHLVCLAKNRLDAALAAPPRNCDRFATVDEARAAHEAICEKYGKCHNGCPLNNEEHYSAFDCFEAWLFTPETKKEGGAK